MPSSPTPQPDKPFLTHQQGKYWGSHHLASRPSGVSEQQLGHTGVTSHTHSATLPSPSSQACVTSSHFGRRGRTQRSQGVRAGAQAGFEVAPVLNEYF